MLSTGNDIVALKAINVARTRQSNFYRKILTVTEKELYGQRLANEMPFACFVWLLWSIKESVYKYLQRIDPQLIFSPTKIKITRIDLPSVDDTSAREGRDFNNQTVYRGEVIFGDHLLYSRSVICEDFIFSVVNHTDNFERVLWGIRQTSSSDPDHLSKSVRVFILTMLKTLFPIGILEVGKSVHGYPVLLKDGNEIPGPVSLAHHDHYIAYSFQIDQG